MAEPFLEKSIHPTVIVRGYTRALEDAIKIVDRMAFPIDTNNRASMLNVVNSCIATKFTHRFGTLMAVGVQRGEGGGAKGFVPGHACTHMLGASGFRCRTAYMDMKGMCSNYYVCWRCVAHAQPTTEQILWAQ